MNQKELKAEAYEKAKQAALLAARDILSFIQHGGGQDQAVEILRAAFRDEAKNIPCGTYAPEIGTLDGNPTPDQYQAMFFSEGLIIQIEEV